MTPATLSILTTLAWAAVGLAAIAAAMTCLNVLAWPRGPRRARPAARGGRPGVTPAPAARASVLIPARDEERGIEAAVRAALAQPEALEVVVYDDRSTDRTPEILASIATEHPRLRVIDGRPLPSGWVGKPYGCHQLAAAARGDWLCFVDADVTLAPGALAALLAMAGPAPAGYAADVVTAVPRQRAGSWFERLVMPLLHLVYVSWLPMPLVWRSRDPRVLAANGQLLLVRRDAYAAVGGFAAVRHAVVDDMAFCRRVKAAGRRVVFADGHQLASCRMYEDARGVWRGFSKNIYAGVGGRPGGLVAVTGLLVGTFLAPYLALAGALLSASPLASPLLAPGLAGVGLNVLQRVTLAIRHRQPAAGVFLHPVAVVALLAIAWNSFRWARAGRIHWAGRVYASGAAGAAALEPTIEPPLEEAHG